MTRWQKAEPKFPTEVSLYVYNWILQINEQSISNLWKTPTKIEVNRVPEREERVGDDRKLFKKKKKEAKHILF